MIFSFHPEAEAEFLEAIAYYENYERGLGYDFSIEVTLSHPKHCQLSCCMAGAGGRY